MQPLLCVNGFSKAMLEEMCSQWPDMVALATAFQSDFTPLFSAFKAQREAKVGATADKKLNSALLKKQADLTWHFWKENRSNAKISAWFEGACIAALLCPTSALVERFFSMAGGKTKRTQKKMNDENLELKSCLAFNADLSEEDLDDEESSE